MSILEIDFLSRDNVAVSTVYDPNVDEKYSILKLKLDNIHLEEHRIKKSQSRNPILGYRPNKRAI